MGCGPSKTKLKLIEETNARRTLESKLSQVRLESATRNGELVREIKKATNDATASRNETMLIKRNSVSMLEQKEDEWTTTNKTLSRKLTETELKADISIADARRMRLIAMEAEDNDEDNKRLKREINGLKTKLSGAKEDLRLARIVFEGQKEVLENEKTDLRNEGLRKLEEENAKFSALEVDLLQEIAHAEQRVRDAVERERLQREANVAMLQVIPRGTASLRQAVH